MIRTSLKSVFFSSTGEMIRVEGSNRVSAASIVEPVQFQNLTLIFGSATGGKMCLGVESWNYEKDK